MWIPLVKELSTVGIQKKSLLYHSTYPTSYPSIRAKDLSLQIGLGTMQECNSGGGH